MITTEKAELIEQLEVDRRAIQDFVNKKVNTIEATEYLENVLNKLDDLICDLENS